jgi:predicted dinucleotide-binding enzyme
MGTGMVGRAWAARLAELGHEVRVGTRDPERTRERRETEGADLFGFAEAAERADLVVNALNGEAVLTVLGGLSSALAGTVVMDISNPLDFSAGFPPRLFVQGGDSLAEQLQRALSEAAVVKAVNTLNATLQVHPERNPGTVFVAGNDAAAKATVTGLLTEVGHEDILDLGKLTAARGLEQWLPLWLGIMGALGTAEFQIKVLRPGVGTGAASEATSGPPPA